MAGCEDDGSPGTLRAAIDGASDGDTIDLTGLSCSLITLQNGTLTSPVTSLRIVGPGADLLTINGNDTFRVLQVPRLEIEGLTVANGRAAGSGACILTDNLSLTDAVLTDCVNFSAGAALGGAAFVSGDLTMHRASIVGSGAAGANYAMGGAAFVGGTATLYASTITGNSVQAGGAAYGGGISANDGITLHASTIENNSARSSIESAYGGGLHSFGGDISILDGSAVSGNLARSEQAYVFGGGVNAGTVLAPAGIAVVRNSTISGNSASSACSVCLVSGGGLQAFDSIDTAYSTFSYNEASCDDPASQCSAGGGGMSALGQSTLSSIAMRNTTISGNTSIGGTQPGAFAAGGGIMGGSGLRIVARNSTIAFNDAATLGGGIAATSSAGTPSELVSTIVADNHSSGGAGDIVAGPFGNDLVLEGSNNMVTAAGAGVTLPGDTSTDEPLLLPLTTANGGVTATHALAAGSPAIDTGANPDAFLFDQRGFPHQRVVGASADIGAYEFDTDPSIFADDFDP
ncbi:MAG: choice-of-anchor Q domain-containing protein [Rhodanobacteraceae bacterium]